MSSASRLSVLDSAVLQLETSELKETSVSDRTTIAFPSGTGTCAAWQSFSTATTCASVSGSATAAGCSRNSVSPSHS